MDIRKRGKTYVSANVNSGEHKCIMGIEREHEPKIIVFGELHRCGLLPYSNLPQANWELINPGIICIIKHSERARIMGRKYYRLQLYIPYEDENWHRVITNDFSWDFDLTARYEQISDRFHVLKDGDFVIGINFTSSNEARKCLNYFIKKAKKQLDRPFLNRQTPQYENENNLNNQIWQARNQRSFETQNIKNAGTKGRQEEDEILHYKPVLKRQEGSDNNSNIDEIQHVPQQTPVKPINVLNYINKSPMAAKKPFKSAMLKKYLNSSTTTATMPDVQYSSNSNVSNIAVKSTDQAVSSDDSVTVLRMKKQLIDKPLHQSTPKSSIEEESNSQSSIIPPKAEIKSKLELFQTKKQTSQSQSIFNKIPANEKPAFNISELKERLGGSKLNYGVIKK